MMLEKSDLILYFIMVKNLKIVSIKNYLFKLS